MIWKFRAEFTSLPRVIQCSVIFLLIGNVRYFWICYERKFTNGTFRKLRWKSTKWQFCNNVEIFSQAVQYSIRWIAPKILFGTSLTQNAATHPGTFLCEAALNYRLEKGAKNNKECGQKAATRPYVRLFHGHINSSGLVVAYGNCRERINKWFRPINCFLRYLQVLSNLLW